MSGRLWAWLCVILWAMEREKFQMCLTLYPLWLTTLSPLRKALLSGARLQNEKHEANLSLI